MRGPYAPPHQRPPCVKGPQGSAACGRTSDRSGPAAACLGGPQRGPGRLSGNPGLSAARLTGGLSTPPALRATSPYTGEALGGYVRRKRSNRAAKRTRDARPYGRIAGWCVCRRRAVGADAFIGPNPPQAGPFGEGALAAQPDGRLLAAPTAGTAVLCGRGPAFGGARQSVLAISPAAAMIWSISSTVWAAERNMASNWLGAAKMPWSRRPRYHRAKRSRSQPRAWS